MVKNMEKIERRPRPATFAPTFSGRTSGLHRAAAALLLACITAHALADDSVRHRHHDTDDLYVCKHGCRFHKIQSAVDAAHSGDTIHIRAGTYFENVMIDGKDLTLAGDSASTTTIDGGFRGTVLTIGPPDFHAGGADISVSLIGMTITHGKGVYGGGISGNVTALEITDCIIVANLATEAGGGIADLVQLPTMQVESSSIVNNQARIGGGIYLLNESSAHITDVTIAHNEAEAGGGLFVDPASRAFINGTTISDNVATAGDGGGVYVSSGRPSGIAFFAHTAVVNNTAAQNGGGVFPVLCSTDACVSGDNVTALNSPRP